MDGVDLHRMVLKNQTILRVVGTKLSLKHVTGSMHCNVDILEGILTIFGTNITAKVSNQKLR